MELTITKVLGREILDSRGNPTVEVEMQGEILNKGIFLGRASVPSGASTGQFEAIELRDGEMRYRGLGVQKAVKHVNTRIREALLGKNGFKQGEIDRLLLELDGTENKSNLGANAMLGVSMACADLAAKALGIPRFQYLGGIYTRKMPVPMMNILNGGRHAANTVDFQEFMIMPVAAESFHEALEMCVVVYHNLKKLLQERGLSTGVGDEGGFAPNLSDSFAVLDVIVEAVKAAGHTPGEDFMIALDAAASELYDEKDGMYHFKGETKARQRQENEEEVNEVVRDTAEMIAYYEELTDKYPIISIEDGLAEDDWDGWQELTKRLGNKVQLVGDDLFVTNVKRLSAGIKLGAANAILVKVNQIGTLTETFETIEMAQKNGYKAVISHRSGETEDTMIADIAVAVNAGQIKTGAPCRTDRVAKYNQLLRIEEELKEQSEYRNPFWKSMETK